MFTGLSEDQQKEIYDKGRDLGEKMIDRYPDSVPIKFWYAANTGRWADVHSFARAATSGISKKLRNICEDIIEKDPNYQDGGGYRILAQVHFYSPHIPLVMGWPSKDKALELVRKALEIAPENPTNKMLYANILLEFDRHQDAKKQLREIRRMSPRATHTVEDRYVQYRSQKLFEEHFN
jgi:predicted Zn-dependent protease